MGIVLRENQIMQTGEGVATCTYKIHGEVHESLTSHTGGRENVTRLDFVPVNKNTLH